MSDIFKEVDDALQQDKLTALWKEYGGVLILAIILLIGGTAATTGYKAWDTSRNQTETSKLLAALQSDTPLDALSHVSTDTRAGQAAIAQFARAGMLAQSNKQAEAASVYKDVFENTSTPAPLDDMARLSYVRAILSSTEQPDSAELLTHLEAIINNLESSYIAQAHLDAALIAGELNQDFTKALSHLAAIDSAQNVQQPLKDRAAKLMQLYTQKQKNKKENS